MNLESTYSVEAKLAETFFLIRNIKCDKDILLPELAVSIIHLYFQANTDAIMLFKFWHNNLRLKKYDNLGTRNDWQITNETEDERITYSSIQCEVPIGDYMRHITFNCFGGGDIWIGIAKHQEDDIEKIYSIMNGDYYEIGFGFWQQIGAFTSFGNNIDYSIPYSDRFLPTDLNRTIELYIDSRENKLYWHSKSKNGQSNSTLLYTHIVDPRRIKIKNMHLSMCIHNVGDRVAIVDSKIISSSLFPK